MTTIDPAKLGAATQFAADAHRAQTRKRAAGDPRPRIPYVSHLLSVCGIAIEDGADTDEAVAALLHDYLEDVPGASAETLEQTYGPRVRHVVQACTGPKAEQAGMADFRTRKGVYLEHLTRETDPGAVRVSLADKVHNARSTVNDLEAEGRAVWDRFNAGVEDQLWWYGGLVAAYTMHADAGRAERARVGELTRLVDRMRALR